jgi:uncharacterized protein (TIGR00369 family)
VVAAVDAALIDEATMLADSMPANWGSLAGSNGEPPARNLGGLVGDGCQHVVEVTEISVASSEITPHRAWGPSFIQIAEHLIPSPGQPRVIRRVPFRRESYVDWRACYLVFARKAQAGVVTTFTNLTPPNLADGRRSPVSAGQHRPPRRPLHTDHGQRVLVRTAMGGQECPMSGGVPGRAHVASVVLVGDQEGSSPSLRAGSVWAGRRGGYCSAMDDFATWIGVHPAAAEDGRARLELEAAERHLNPAGTVHGGVLATLVDTAMGAAVRSTTDGSEVPATSQLSIVYLRPGSPGRLLVTAEVRKKGEHLLVCDADIEQDGQTMVHAVATFAVLTPRHQ